MKTQQLLRCIFPEILADYFEVIDIQESISQIDFWLDERNFMEKEDRKVGTVSSYGFTSERVVQDFPLRGKAVYLHVRRRKWRDSSTGEIFSYSYDDLTAEGSKLSPEFVSFFKRIGLSLPRRALQASALTMEWTANSFLRSTRNTSAIIASGNSCRMQKSGYCSPII